MPDLTDLYAWIDAHADEAVADLQTLLRQPSISAQGIGLDDCADLLCALMRRDGIAGVGRYPTNGGPDVVYAEVAGAGPRRLLCYGHYDVQPPEPLERWESPPFAAEIRDGVIYARGACDNKSGVLAFVKAARAFRETRGAPPVALKMIFEGEEEVGSPHLEEWSLRHRQMLACDASIGLDGGVDRTGLRPEIQLGIKAILYVELRARGATEDFWSGRAQLLGAQAPAWRIVHALGTIFDRSGRITIDGWYDDWQEPDTDDLEQLRREAELFDRAELLRQLGLSSLPFLDTIEGDMALLRAIHFGASCNIAGLVAGYTGEGSKTIVPREAVAKIDFRCPPDLEPELQLAKLRAHLERHGFGDLEVIIHTARKNPYKTPVAEAISQATIAAANRVFGAQPIVQGVSTQGTIKIHVPHPAVMSGFGSPDNRLHAPNENMPIARYIQGIKYAATIMAEFAAR